MSIALQVENLVKTYANGTTALHGVSFSVAEGDFFALLGPNGAGKSTTLGIITSLVNKSSGKVRIFGYDTDKDLHQAKTYLGTVPQEFNCNIFDKVLDIVVNQAGYYGIPRRIALARAEMYLQRLGLWEKRAQASRLLSGGMKRRLMIARALIHQPRLLILDEPTAGVDIELRRSLWDFLRDLNQQGTTIILTTHYLEEAENLCRHLAIIHQGHLIEQASLRTVLDKLAIETFIFYLAAPLSQAPQFSGFTCRLIDALTLEVDMQREQSLTALFACFQAQGVVITRMRNKANRLEELFLRLTAGEQST